MMEYAFEAAAEAEDFGVDLRPTPASAIHVFKDEHASAFAEHEAVASPIEWPRDLLRRQVGAARERAERRVGHQQERIEPAVSPRRR